MASDQINLQVVTRIVQMFGILIVPLFEIKIYLSRAGRILSPPPSSPSCPCACYTTCPIINYIVKIFHDKGNGAKRREALYDTAEVVSLRYFFYKDGKRTPID